MTDPYANIRRALDVIDECADGTLLMTRDRCARLRKAADTIRELLAERDQLAAALEAARVDAERWRHARRILTVEDIESSQDMFDAFGVEGDEHENRKVDAAIDAHLREELRGAREAGWNIDTKHLLEDRDGCD